MCVCVCVFMAYSKQKGLCQRGFIQGEFVLLSERSLICPYTCLIMQRGNES